MDSKVELVTCMNLLNKNWKLLSETLTYLNIT